MGWWPGGITPGGGEERIISAGAFIININSSYCDDYIIIRLQLLTDMRIVAGTTGMPVEPLLSKMRNQIIGDLISG